MPQGPTMCHTLFPGPLTWLESPVQVSGMSHSFTASRQDTPRGSYCPGHKPNSAGTGQDPTGSTPDPAPPRARWMLPAPHLAALAAEPVAAHGVVGQGAFLAAVSPAPRTLLPGQQPESAPGSPAAPSTGGGAAPEPAHRQRAAVALLARLHEAIAALGGVQELPGPRGDRTHTHRGVTHRGAAGDPEPAAATSPRKGHRIPGERQHPQTAARHEGPALWELSSSTWAVAGAGDTARDSTGPQSIAVTPRGAGGSLPSGAC